MLTYIKLAMLTGPVHLVLYIHALLSNWDTVIFLISMSHFLSQVLLLFLTIFKWVYAQCIRTLFLPILHNQCIVTNEDGIKVCVYSLFHRTLPSQMFKKTDIKYPIPFATILISSQLNHNACIALKVIAACVTVRTYSFITSIRRGVITERKQNILLQPVYGWVQPKK